MKTSIKTLIISLIITILFVGGYYTYSDFYGDPITKHLATRKINAYINTKYPEEAFQIQSVKFEFKPKLYVADVYCLNDEDIHFRISIKKGGSRIFSDQYIYKYAKDHILTERFANSLEASIMEELIDEMPQLTKVSVVMYIEKDKYPVDIEYSSLIEESYSVILYFEGERIFKKEFVELCYKAKEIIKAEGFLVDEYSFDYREHYKEREGLGYSLELNKDQLDFSIEEMLLIENLTIYGSEEIIRKYSNQ